jgi:arylsulfatase A-like enzyme
MPDGPRATRAHDGEPASTRVLLIGLDGFPARMVSPDRTPRLWGLAASGGRAADGGLVASLPSTTYPGFASLLTGCRPERHGVRTTAVRPGAVPGWAGRRSVATPTLFDACRAAGLRSAAIQGDHLLHEVLATDRAVDLRWPPAGPLDPVLRLDAKGYPVNDEVRPVALRAIAEPDLRFLFVHLNEPDTYGHLVGPEHPATIACYGATDALVGEFVDALAPDWERSIVIVVSDHDMEPAATEPPIRLRADPDLATLTADELADGGAALLAVADGVDQTRVAAAAKRVEGVADARPAGRGIVLVEADRGRVFGVPQPGGVHGGPSTVRTLALVGGGHPAARHIGARIASRPPTLADWAPTIAELLGLALPTADGQSLLRD